MLLKRQDFLPSRKLSSPLFCRSSAVAHNPLLYNYFYYQMELHLKIIGTLLIVLALLHISFPKYFNWKQDLSSVSIINRQVMYIHSFFIALIVFLMGLLCQTSSDEILNTVLGKRIALGLGVFWTMRLIIQFFGYSAKIWKGKAFETTVHILFSIFWIYLSIIFNLIYFG